MLDPQVAPLTAADVPGIWHVGIPRRVDAAWESAAGGVGRDVGAATLAAIGESIERSSAALARPATLARNLIDPAARVDPEDWHLFTPAQRGHPQFPFGGLYDDALAYVEVNALGCPAGRAGATWWAPEPLVVLRDDARAGVVTSSGLAAATAPTDALARALLELVERDALVVTWLGGLPGRERPLPFTMRDEVGKLGGDCRLFDLTPLYSPVPVAAIAGWIGLRGKRRLSLGVACRATWDEAVEKAYLEWNQGVLFAGIFDEHAPDQGPLDPQRLRTFDEHAIYYTRHPERWDNLPLWAAASPASEPPREVRGPPDQVVASLSEAFAARGMRAGWVDLTTIDARQLGVHVIRAVSPDLASIFAHQEWPHLHRVQEAVADRYPDLVPAAPFPLADPHPLG